MYQQMDLQMGVLNTKHWLINRCDYPADEHTPLQKNPQKNENNKTRK